MTATNDQRKDPMQVKTKGDATIIKLTKPEIEKLTAAAAILREVARYPERFPQAGKTSNEITEIAEFFSQVD